MEFISNETEIEFLQAIVQVFNVLTIRSYITLSFLRAQDKPILINKIKKRKIATQHTHISDSDNRN